MIIIWGHRWYGRGFPRGPHHVATRGFHVWYIPIIPGKQLWITAVGGGQVRGLPVKWSWRAAMPVFAIQWGAIAAGIAAASIAPIAALPVFGGALAAWLWGWKGSHPGGKREEQRRSLTQKMLGTGCPDHLFAPEFVRDVAPKLDKLWGDAIPDRSPEDVAALGPRHQYEAALAYTLLAVRAQLERGELAAKLRARAEQVLDALEKTPSLPEGAPYRAEVRLPETTS